MVRGCSGDAAGWRPPGPHSPPRALPQPPAAGGVGDGSVPFQPTISPVARRQGGRGAVHERLYEQAARIREEAQLKRERRDKELEAENAKKVVRADGREPVHERLYNKAVEARQEEDKKDERKKEKENQKAASGKPQITLLAESLGARSPEEYYAKQLAWEEQRQEKRKRQRADLDAKEDQKVRAPEISKAAQKLERTGSPRSAGERLYSDALRQRKVRQEAQQKEDEEARANASPAITPFAAACNAKGSPPAHRRLYQQAARIAPSPTPPNRGGVDPRVTLIFEHGDTDGDGLWSRREWASMVRLCGGGPAPHTDEEFYRAHCLRLGADPLAGLTVRHLADAYRPHPERLSVDHLRICLRRERARLPGGARCDDARIEWLALGLGALYAQHRTEATESELAAAVVPNGYPDPAGDGEYAVLARLLRERLSVPSADLEWLGSPPPPVSPARSAAAAHGEGGTPRRGLRHPLAPGSRCEGKDAEGEWWPVIITAVHPDGTYSAEVICEDDGEEEEDGGVMQWPSVHPANMRPEAVELRLLRQGAEYGRRRLRSAPVPFGFAPHICPRSREIAATQSEASCDTPVEQRLTQHGANAAARRARAAAHSEHSHSPQVSAQTLALAAKAEARLLSASPLRVEDRLILRASPRRGDTAWKSPDHKFWTSLRRSGDTPEDSTAFRPHSEHAAASAAASSRGRRTPSRSRGGSAARPSPRPSAASYSPLASPMPPHAAPYRRVESPAAAPPRPAAVSPQPSPPPARSSAAQAAAAAASAAAAEYECLAGTLPAGQSPPAEQSQPTERQLSPAPRRHGSPPATRAPARPG